MSPFGMVGVVAVTAAVLATPALSQQVISEPGYCAFFYPNANCQNQGPGNPYTDPSFHRGPGGYERTWAIGETVGIAPKRKRMHRTEAATIRLE